jgi:hypothetical protein
MYFSGQGKVEVAPRINDVIGQYRWLGNVPDLKPTFDTSKIEHNEAWSGQRQLDKVVVTQNKMGFTADVEDWSPENMAISTRGKVNQMVSGSVTDVAPDISPDNLVVGGIWAFRHQKVSAVTIKDNSSTPVTVDPDDYELDSEYGDVVIKNLGTYDLPLRAVYTYESSTIVAFFTQPAIEVALRFKGINTADGNRKVLAEIYRVSLDPTKELSLITNDMGKFVLAGNGLIDSTKPDDLVFGRFGRMVYL